MRLLMQIVSVLWTLLLLLVGGRFLLLLFGANPESSLVQWVFGHSQFWVAPFFGIFHMTNKAVDTTGGNFEPASLLAFAVYAVVGSVVFWALSAPFTGSWYGRWHSPLGV
jgi:hypothetical protein